jgi:hypothetical protein
MSAQHYYHPALHPENMMRRRALDILSRGKSLFTGVTSLTKYLEQFLSVQPAFYPYRRCRVDSCVAI